MDEDESDFYEEAAFDVSAWAAASIVSMCTFNVSVVEDIHQAYFHVEAPLEVSEQMVSPVFGSLRGI